MSEQSFHSALENNDNKKDVSKAQVSVLDDQSVFSSIDQTNEEQEKNAIETLGLNE